MAGGLKAETVIKNANVITIDTRMPRAEAIAISGGKIAGVGSNQDMEGLTGPGTRILDVGGKTVLPGFIDAHTHVMSSGVRHVAQADCAKPSIAAIQDALREQASKKRPGEWVQGFNFDDTKTSENRFLNRADLDAVSREHPIFVAHRAGLVYYFNSKALEAAGYNRDTQPPPGGYLEKDPATGELTGVVYQHAAEWVERELIPHPTDDDRRNGLKIIMDMYAKAGATTVHDAMVSADEFRVYQEARQKGELPLRVYLLMHHSHFPALRDAGVRSGFGDDRLRLGGIKISVDGGIASRTAYLSSPYEGSQDDRGFLAVGPEETERKVMEWHRAGFQICIHANGDSAIEQVLTAYEKVQAEYPRTGIRHRIEHCTVVNPDILRRMRSLGCVATPFCTYVYYHGEKMQYYGKERVEWMFAQRSFIDGGIVSTGAADYPCGMYPPLMGIQACVTRTDMHGNVWGPSQRVTVEEALKIYTINGAYASFEEGVKGSIEVGKLADLVMLAEDPTAVEAEAIIDIPVEMTMVGGEIVHEA